MISGSTHSRRTLCLQLLAWMASPAIGAQSKNAPNSVWPAKAVNVVVPFPAGGASAILGKHLSAAFERATQKSMRLDYRGGAGGLYGASYAASTPADGYHMLVGGSHLAKLRALMPDADFDLINDLTPLALLARVPQVVIINPARMRVRTVTEWMLELRRKPSRFRVATAGLGSSSHIAAEILRLQQTLNFEFVHFRGSGPALQDLLAGSVDTMVDGLVSCLPYVRSGQLKALMVSGKERLPMLPDVPCAAELGVDALDSLAWYGLFAPKQLNDKLQQSILAVLQSLGQETQLQEAYAAMGVAWGGVYGDDFAAMVAEQTQQWAQRLKSIGFKRIQLKEGEEV